jgi:hypothetical protein
MEQSMGIGELVTIPCCSLMIYTVHFTAAKTVMPCLGGARTGRQNNADPFAELSVFP